MMRRTGHYGKSCKVLGVPGREVDFPLRTCVSDSATATLVKPLWVKSSCWKRSSNWHAGWAWDERDSFCRTSAGLVFHHRKKGTTAVLALLDTRKLKCQATFDVYRNLKGLWCPTRCVCKPEVDNLISEKGLFKYLHKAVWHLEWRLGHWSLTHLMLPDLTGQ